MNIRTKVENFCQGGIWSVNWTHDNKIITGSVDGSVRVWQHANSSITNTPLVEHFEQKLGIVRIASNFAKKVFATSSLDNTINIYDLQDSKCKLLKTIETGPVEAWAIAFSVDGKYLASTGQGGNITIWDWENSKKETVLSTSSKFTYDVDFSPDGSFIATCSLNGSIHVFSTTSFSPVCTITHGTAIRSIHFPTNQTLIALSDAPMLTLYDIPNGTALASHNLPSVGLCCVSKSESEFAIGMSDGRVQVLNQFNTSQKTVSELQAHEGQVWGLKWKGTQIVSVGSDDVMILYDV